MPRLSALPAILACVLLVACGDEKSVQVTPTAPLAQDAARLSVSTATTTSAQSSVCAAFIVERDETQAALAKTPNDTKLQQEVASLQAMVDDVCN